MNIRKMNILSACLRGGFILPILILASRLAGFILSPAWHYVLSSACAVMMVTALVILLKDKALSQNPKLGIQIGHAAVSCSLGASFYVFGKGNLPFLFLMLLSAIISFYLLRRCALKFWIRLTASVLSGILIFPTVVMTPISVLMQDFGKVTVVKSVLSPDQKYEAQLIDIDQGALGGATEIQVVKHRKNKNRLFYIEKSPMEIYSTGWGAADDLDIEWMDENTLLINGVQYPIQ